MVLKKIKAPLQLQEWPMPVPLKYQVLIKVSACGICRTDLHVVDGELPDPILPLVPGHQIVGRVSALGEGVSHLHIDDRVGVPWLGGACGHCRYCLLGQENLCDEAKYTGYQLQGGFADYCVADSRFVLPLPDTYPDKQAALLLCAGLIGYRALRAAGEAQNIGFYGFGASAHILTQVAAYQKKKVFAFTKPDDTAGQAFAKSLGAFWAGGTNEPPPEELDAALLFAPVGSLVPLALSHVRKGGQVISAGIHMSDIPSFPYKLLWGERSIHSIANLTRKDGHEFLALAPQIPVHTQVTSYPLEQVNQALDDLRHGRFKGAARIEIA
jgi:propanol-preferring alcohol dehydrogenase